jgi:4-hydroxy-2-oxoheptanedioate aldolase
MKDVLSGQLPVLGTWLSVPQSSVIETLSQSAFDFILFDGKHAPIPPTSWGSLLPAAERHGAAVWIGTPFRAVRNV